MSFYYGTTNSGAADACSTTGSGANSGLGKTVTLENFPSDRNTAFSASVRTSNSCEGIANASANIGIIEVVLNIAASGTPDSYEPIGTFITSTNSIKLENLDPESDYRFQVIAIRGDGTGSGNSAISDWEDFATDDTQCATPHKSYRYSGSGSTSLDDAVWEESIDGGAWVSSKSVPENDDLVEKIYIQSGEVSVSSGTYKTGVLELGATAKMSVSGTADITSGTLVMTSGDEQGGLSATANTSQLKLAGGTISADVVKLKKRMEYGKWHQVAFPFNVGLIERTHQSVAGGLVKMAINNSTFYVSYYDGASRADEGNENSGDMGASAYWVETTQIKANTGYLVGQLGSSISGNDTIIFTSDGLVDIQDVTVGGSYSANYFSASGSSSAKDKGWAMVANPYVTAFDLRTATNSPFCYVYNKVAGEYEIVGQEDDDLDPHSVEPFKAFFIKQENATFAYDASLSNLAYRASDASELPFDEVRLKFFSGEIYDLCRVRLRDGANEGYDPLFDGFKLFDANTTKQQLYSKQNGLNLAINSLPRHRQNSTIVNLSALTPSAGSYRIVFEPSARSENVVGLWLKDKLSGVVTNLLQTPDYGFISGKRETINDRFELEIALRDEDTGTGMAYVNIGGKIIAVVSGNYVSLRGLNELSAVSLFDASGRHVAGYENIDNEQPFYAGTSGIYLLKVSNATQSATLKVFIK